MNRIRKHISRRKAVALGVVIVVVALAGTLVSCQRHPAKKSSSSGVAGSEKRGGGSEVVRVNSVSPRRDASLELTVEEPAYVEAYIQAHLEARVAGPVSFIQKGIGASVEVNEPLVRIDVPDLTKEVAMKQAIIDQRKSELTVAEASVKIATASMRAAGKDVQVAQTQATAAAEEQDFRRLEYERFKQLATKDVIYKDIVDEKLKWFNVAKANKVAAEANVLKSEALLEEATEKTIGAQADVALKRSLINVAQADCDQAQARLDLATIKAPWNGSIVARGVDPGTFVHSAATTEHGKALFTLERTDLVTVYMKVPDAYAPYVDEKTKAIIEMDELPGHTLTALVTRKSGTLQNPESDRTMRVEVDIFNCPKCTKAEYEKFKTDEKANDFKDLKDKTLPQFPEMTDKPGLTEERPLMPGMYGKMKLVLRNFHGYLLPSDAIVREGGTPYIYVVEEGSARRVEVSVDLDDGKHARVQLLTASGDKRPLTGREEIVFSNQGEISDGQAVESSHVDWE
jgi:hypothetical protein